MKSNSKKRSLNLFLVLGIVLAVAGVSAYSLFFKKQRSSTVFQQSSTELMRFPEAVVWQAFNDGKEFDIPYSVEVPFTGPYCDCIDATGGLDGDSLVELEGGFFDGKWQGEEAAHWLVLSYILTDQSFEKDPGGWEVPTGNLIVNLTKHKVGDHFFLVDSKGEKKETVRLADKVVNGSTFTTFQTDMNSFGFGSMSRKFALLKRGKNTLMLSFEYDQKYPLYASVFDHMIESYKPQYRDAKNYTKNLDDYFNSYLWSLPNTEYSLPTGIGTLKYLSTWRVEEKKENFGKGVFATFYDSENNQPAITLSRYTDRTGFNDEQETQAQIQEKLAGEKKLLGDKISVSIVRVNLGGRYSYEVSYDDGLFYFYAVPYKGGAILIVPESGIAFKAKSMIQSIQFR